LTLSKTKRSVSAVSGNSETASFGVLVEPQLETLDAKQALFAVFFCFVDVHYGSLRFVSVSLSFRSRSNTNKPKQLGVSVCFGSNRNKKKGFAGHPIVEQFLQLLDDRSIRIRNCLLINPMRIWRKK
jgi:hypothetical protein